MNTVEAWRRVLSAGESLSGRFVARHARVLANACAGCDSELVARAAAVAAVNPRGAARLLLGVPERSGRAASRDVVSVDGDGSLESWIRSHNDLDGMLGAQPALERTWVPLHPARRATRVDGPAGPLVALVWDAVSVDARACHRGIVEHIAHAANAEAGSGFRVSVPDEYTVVRMSEGDPWVFAPDYGATLEDRLRDNSIHGSVRARVMDGLVRLRTAMLNNGVVWQGFAPRNMFLHDDRLVLIDFEDCTRLDDNPVGAAEQLLWHEVFFADCLTDQERAALFFDHPRTPVPDDAVTLRADKFEAALLGTATVTWSTRRELLAQSARLEGRHPRPSDQRDGAVLFGHELGHFWGDFLPPEKEAALFVHLSTVQGRALVSCLEVFEAAMEADIDALLRAEAIGDARVHPARTLAVIDAMSASPLAEIAAARDRRVDWYQGALDSPARLVDDLLFDLAQGEVDVDAFLVGAAGARAEHTSRLTRTVETGLAFLHGDDHGEHMLRHTEPDELLKLISEPIPVDGADFDMVLGEVDDRIARYSISQAHPAYLAFPDSGNAVAALAGSMLTRLLNQNLIAVDRSAPAATFATVQVIEWLRELVGYDTVPITELRGVRDMAGLWTTGGHLSNHIAMLTALGARFPQARRHGVAAVGTRPVVVMAGSIAHYSHSDAAFHLGLGWDAVLDVRTRPDYTTDPEAVDALLSDPPDGVTPFMVIGVAGNCRTTGLDDLTALAQVCRRHGVWFHADACHGGSLIFNERLKQDCLAGIELADSVSLDPHKGLFTPYPSSYLVVRKRGVLTQFSRHTGVVEQDGTWDLGLITPFLGSCGFEALPTWMLLKHVGTRALGELVEARQALVRHIQRRLDDTGLFVRLNDVDFYRVAFVFCPPPVRSAIRRGADRDRAVAVVNSFTADLNERLYRSGLVCFDEHTLLDLDNRVELGSDRKYTVMACCPGNPLTTIADLNRAVEVLLAAARGLTTGMLAALDGVEHDAIDRVSGPAGWNDQ